MNKKAKFLFALLVLLSACDRNKSFLSKEPIRASADSFATVEEAPATQPQFLSKKSEKEQQAEQILPPFGGFPGPEAIPNTPVILPPPPIATDDDLAPPLVTPGPAVFPFARCGNGGLPTDTPIRFPEGVEQCDFGLANLSNSRGCNIVCGKPFCGNGVTESLIETIPPAGTETTVYKEECDDGNNLDGDGCSARCLFERCGNGRIDPGEECDDASPTKGNNTAGSGCSPCCLIEKCGNGRADFNEQCDDGNTVNGDGCSDCCKRETTPARAKS